MSIWTFGPKCGATEAAAADGMRKASIATASRAVTTPTGIIRRVRDTKRPGTRIIAGAPKAPAVLSRLFNRRGPGIGIENKSRCGQGKATGLVGGDAIVRPICSLSRGHYQPSGADRGGVKVVRRGGHF